MSSSHDSLLSQPRPVLPSEARGLIVEGTFTSIRAMFQSMKWGWLGRAPYGQATAEKRLVLVDGGSHYHTNARGASQYRQALRELFGLGAGAAPVASAE